MADTSKNVDGEAEAATAASFPQATDSQAEAAEASKASAEEVADSASHSDELTGSPGAHDVQPNVLKTTPELAGAVGKAAPGRKAGFKSASKAQKSAEPKPSIKKLKEKIMAINPEFNEAMTTNVTNTVAEMQDRSKAAFEKSTELMTEMTDFAKGTVEALVESGKIFSGAVQDMGKTYAEEAKSAYELMTADLKEMAAIKSPTELFQLQGKIMRRNFDAVVSTTSKNAEKVMKLSNDVFAPLSARMNVAAEKISKVA